MVRRKFAASHRPHAALLGFLAASSLVAPFAASTHPEPTNWNCPPSQASTYPNLFQCQQNVWDEQTIVYIESNGAAAAPFLSFDDPDAGTETSHVIATATSGPSSAVANFGTAKPQPLATIQLPGTLPHDYYFNLSRSILGNLYFTHGVNQNQNVGKKTEWGLVRVELYSGDKRVAGYEEAFTPATATDAWIRLSVNLWPETPLLRAGDSLSLRISRTGGLADFILGTGGDHQSSLDLRYSSLDPLGGTLYLKNGKIVPYDGGLDAGPSADSSDASMPLLAVLALLALARLRRPRALGPVLLVLVVAFAGCFGGGHGVKGSGAGEDDPGAGEEKRPIETQFQPSPAGSPAAAGQVEGIVKDDVGLPLPSAHVALLATNHYSQTDNRGRFGLENVTAGLHRLRVDRDGFAPFDGEIEVRRGNVTLLNVTLYPATPKAANYRPHAHGPFAGSLTQVELWSGSFSFNGCRAGTSFQHACELPIPYPLDKPIPPGTGLLRFVATWDDVPGGMEEVGLVATPAKWRPQMYFRGTGTSGGGSAFNGPFFVPRASGEPIHVPIQPTEADPGHQQFTTWSFHLRTSLLDPAGPSRAPDTTPVTVEVKITAFKGVLPFEPPHKDLWAGRSEFRLVDHVPKGPGTLQMATGNFPNQAVRWNVPTTAWVPPGTKEIRGYLKIERGPLDDEDWRLLYKPANSAQTNTANMFHRPVQLEGSGDNRPFTIRPLVNETDQFYQSQTYWSFAVDDDDADPLLPYETRWTLGATAFRDEEFQDDAFA